MKKLIGSLLILIGIVIAGLTFVTEITNSPRSISIINSSDGPTSIFLAGKVGGASTVGTLVVSIFLIILGTILIVRKKK